MHVVVGPVASVNASAFADFAEQVLAEHGADLPADVRDGFGTYLVEWRALAARGPSLEWVAAVPVEVGEYLVLAFYRLARQLDENRPSPAPIVPAEAFPFYQALVEGLLTAMAQEGAGSAEFSEHLRSFWPIEPGGGPAA